MKIHIKIALTIIAILTSALFFGCEDEPPEEMSPARKACIEAMQKVPVYYEDFEFWDVATLRDDPDLGDMYQVWYERGVDFLEEHYGIESEKIKYLAEGGTFTIIQTDYDIDALRDKLKPDFYQDTSYGDMEVWKSPQNISGSFILLEGQVIRGGNVSDVDDYFRVVSGGELSMYDKNAAELLERLPEGVMTRINREPYPLGNIIYGMSVRKDGGNKLWWTHIHKFESVEAAENAEASEYFQGIKDGFANTERELAKRGESYRVSDFSMERDGVFIEWSMLVDVEYMIALLFYG